MIFWSINKPFLDLFFKLKKLWAKQGRDFQEFNNFDLEKDETLDEILNEVFSQIKYKSTKEWFLKRIKKAIQNKNFSPKDVKILKKFVNLQENADNIFYKRISYFFPGKQTTDIIQEIQKYLIEKDKN